MTTRGLDKPCWIAGAALVGLLGGCGEASQAEAGPQEASEPELGFTGALDLDCTHSGRNSNGVEVFLAPCPRSAVSPDGKWRLVNAGAELKDSVTGPDVVTSSDYVFVEDATGRRIGPVPGLSDGMPFAAFWSPRSGWFFVDHHAGSFMQVPEVFEIRSGGVVRHDGFLLAGRNAAQERFPCLPPRYEDWALGNVMGWSRDGRRLAWVLRTRIDVCMDPGQTGPVRGDQVVYPMVMVSDIESGRVIEGSVIVLDDETGQDFVFPDSEPYQDIVTPG